MQQFIDQAIHNEKFHECVHTNFTDSFFDWKITILFYTAIHYLKALAAKRNIDIGNTHADIERNLKFPITKMVILLSFVRDRPGIILFSALYIVICL